MKTIQDNIDMLGLMVKDKVTGMQGVVASVSFDLYGCVQCVVNPGLGKDGKLMDSAWFDVARLKVLSASPVMERPDFCTVKGPAEKPACFKA